jgi:hypothetical protein
MWQIHFYEDRRGKSPVLEFINSLSPKDRAKVNNIFRLLEEFGTNLGMPHARRIEGGYGSSALATIACFTFSTWSASSSSCTVSASSP